MKEKSVWNEKNSGSRADPEYQRDIRGLQRMICSEWAVRESRPKTQNTLPPEVMVGGWISTSSVIKYRIVQWSWMITIEIYIEFRN